MAALPVACPYIDAALSTACRWTGTLDQFGEHQHLFGDPPHDLEHAEATARRATKRARSDEDDDDVADDVTPPPKVFRLGTLNITLLGYGLQIDRSGVRFHLDGSIDTSS